MTQQNDPWCSGEQRLPAAISHFLSSGVVADPVALSGSFTVMAQLMSLTFIAVLGAFQLMPGSSYLCAVTAVFLGVGPRGLPFLLQTPALLFNVGPVGGTH